MKALRILTLTVVAVLAGPLPPAAADQRGPAPEETRSRVPELAEFHGVIRKLWHDAWPNRQCDTLRAMLPEIQAGADRVAAAKLPGILREKQTAWDEGVKQLQVAVEEYAAAVAGTDDQALLDAGERLHAQFEWLARALRPAMKELDAFHVVLYKLYHYDLPANDREAIRESVERLREPMAALRKARLPERLESRQKDFDAGRQRLAAALDRLAAAVKKKGGDEQVRQRVEQLHERYEALVDLFE